MLFINPQKSEFIDHVAIVADDKILQRFFGDLDWDHSHRTIGEQCLKSLRTNLAKACGGILRVERQVFGLSPRDSVFGIYFHDEDGIGSAICNILQIGYLSCPPSSCQFRPQSEKLFSQDR